MAIKKYTPAYTEDEHFSTVVTEDEHFPVDLTQVITVAAGSHEELANRDGPDQHPIDAITHLSAELNGKIAGGNTITNHDIYSIIGG